MKKYFLLFCVSILLSCEGKLHEKKQDKIYVISENDSTNKLFVFREDEYYSKFNLILGDSDKIYFFRYYNHSLMNCIPSDNPPHFLDLNTSDIFQIQLDSIDDFIKLNDNKGAFLAESIYNIASPQDSIKSKAFEKIIDVFSSIKQKKYIVRRTTMEEDTVLYYKVNNRSYDPKKIKWDTTKVNLRDRIKIEPVLK